MHGSISSDEEKSLYGRLIEGLAGPNLNWLRWINPFCQGSPSLFIISAQFFMLEAHRRIKGSRITVSLCRLRGVCGGWSRPRSERLAAVLVIDSLRDPSRLRVVVAGRLKEELDCISTAIKLLTPELRGAVERVSFEGAIREPGRELELLLSAAVRLVTREGVAQEERS